MARLQAFESVIQMCIRDSCYTAGLLHRLGDLALLRTLQDWCDGGGALDEARLDELLDVYKRQRAGRSAGRTAGRAG